MRSTELGGSAVAVVSLIIVALQSSVVAGPLHDATKRGDSQKVRELLVTVADVNKDLDEYGATALHWAAVKGQKQIAEMLLDKGAKVEAKNRDGDTPLHLAVAFRHKDMVELLLAKGAAVDERRREGTTPLYIAVDRNEKGIVEALLAAGAQMGAKNRDGVTPLYRAAGKNLLDMASLLLSKGADPNAVNKDGDTPLHVAAAYGNKQMVELLLSKGGDPHAKSKGGTTPGDFAKQQGHTGIAELLNTLITLTTYRDDANKFSLKHPENWRVLRDAEIASLAGGMTGTKPCFAIQAPSGGSMFIIAAPSLSNATARLGTDAEAALKEQYLHLAGKVPDNWTKMSEALQTVGGIKCLVVLWKMPPIQGTVLIQKHACMIHDGRAFFLSATGDANKWSQLDAEVISPLFDSFRVSPPNPAAPSHQSNKQNDKTGKSTTGDNSGGMGIGGGILIAVITYIFLRVAILRK